MRECVRVLKPGGRFVGTVIHSPPGADASIRERADELGPSAASVVGSLDGLAFEAGFGSARVRDVTPEFRASCEALNAYRDANADALVADLGREEFDEQVRRTENMLLGIAEGILMRGILEATV